MPVTEADVAITERLSAHNPFRAVLKQTVHDFIVNEISQRNHVLTLTTLPRVTPKRPRPSPPSPAHVPFSEVDQFFPSRHPPPSAALSAAIAHAASSHSFPVLKDKPSRTALHQWLRSHLPSYVADTLQTDQGQVIRIRRRSETRPWKRRRKQARNDRKRDAQAPDDNTYDPRDDHNQDEQSFPRNSLVNFVLWKKNRDTTEALTMVANALSRSVKHFFYAGTKDKRAVTTQLVQVRGVQESELARANSKLLQRDRNHPSVLIGNVSLANAPKSSHLRLGDLNGNRFTLVLRDVENHCDHSLETATSSIRQVGFINYFGLQRFGSGVSPTHVTGFAVLRADFKEVCRRILLPLRIGDDETKMTPGRKRFVQALDKFAEDEITASQLLPQLAPWQRIERAIVDSFASDERKGVAVRDYKKAFGRLPRFLRMMYGHAVQSYLWNVMASERIRLNKPHSTSNMHAIEGDLITEEDVPEGELSFKTKVRQVTKEEEKSKSISVHRVLIPVLGSEVQLPSVPYAKKVQDIIEAEKLDFKHARSEYQVKGTYRRLLAVPKDFEFRSVSYTDMHDIVVPSQVDDLVAQLSDKNATQTNGTKSSEEAKQVQKIGESVEADVMNGENGEGVNVKKSEDEKDAATPNKLEGDKSETTVRDLSKGDEADGKDSATGQTQQGAGTSDAGPQAAEESAIMKQGSPEDAGVEPGGADEASKSDDAAQSKEEARALDNDKAIQRDGEECGDVQMEDLAKDQGGDQKRETCEVEAAKGIETNGITGVGHVVGLEVEGEQGTGTEKEDKEAVDCDGKVSIAPKVSAGEGKGVDDVRKAHNAEEPIATEKVVNGKADEQNVLVEDASHDKVEDASGNDVVPHRIPTSKEDGGNIDLEPGDPSKSEGKGDDDGSESRRALVISFSLGCAEYATMLVRELTGYESSTAVQKELQEALTQS